MKTFEKKHTSKAKINTGIRIFFNQFNVGRINQLMITMKLIIERD